MRNYRLLCAFVIGLLFSGPVFSSEKTHSDWARLNQLLTQNTHQQAQFKQERWLSILNQPLVSSGHYIVKKNQLLLWQLDTPFSLSYEFDGTTLIQEENHQRQTIAARDDHQLYGFFMFMFKLMNGDNAELEKNFALSHIRAEQQIHIIELTPKNTLPKKSFKNIQLKINNSNLEHITINEVNGDKVQLTFSALTSISPP